MSLVIVLSGHDMEVKDPAWLSRTSEDMVKANGRDSEVGRAVVGARAVCWGARRGPARLGVGGEEAVLAAGRENHFLARSGNHAVQAG